MPKKIRMLMTVAVFAIFASPSSFAADGKRSCNLIGFQELCAKIPRTNDPYIKLPDGTRFRNPRQREATPPRLTSAELARGRQRIEQKFEWVKRKMVDEILAGRSLSEMNADQKMFIARIESLRVSARSTGCQGEAEGNYDPRKHEVSLCAEGGLQPDAQLIWTLAHEAGHAIDGCNCQHDRMARHRPFQPRPGQTLGDTDRRTLEKINEGSSFLLEPRDVGPSLMGSVTMAEGLGVLTRVDVGLDPARFPLNPILSCMVEHRILPQGEESPPRGGECRRRGSFTETPSDMWGSRIAGIALAEKPPTSDLEKIATLSEPSIAMMCAEPSVPGKARPPLAHPKWSSQLPSTERYIPDRFRDEATFLSDPRVQSALGCSPDPRMGNCMALFPKAMRDWGQSRTAPASNAVASPEEPSVR